MKQVAQRITVPEHVTSEGEVLALPKDQRGDCMRASVASLFELDYEDVYDFWEGDDWWNGFQGWLARFGLYCRTREASDFAPWKGTYLVVGRSPRGPWGHMAVGEFGKLDDAEEWGWKVVWDPHPAQEGFANGIEQVWELRCFDPALLSARRESVSA